MYREPVATHQHWLAPFQGSLPYRPWSLTFIRYSGVFYIFLGLLLTAMAALHSISRIPLSASFAVAIVATIVIVRRTPKLEEKLQRKLYTQR